MGTGTYSGHVEISGRFTAKDPIALDRVTLSLSQLLDEQGGARELIKGAGATALLPLTLQPRTGGKKDTEISVPDPKRTVQDSRV